MTIEDGGRGTVEGTREASEQDDHDHEWERGKHMAEAFGVDGRTWACAICGVPRPTVATSPRPWRVAPGNWEFHPHVVDADGSYVVGAGDEEDDQRLIVAAVNDYDRLRAIEAAARALVEEGEVECWDPDCQVKPLRLRQLRSALSPTSPEKPEEAK